MSLPATGIFEVESGGSDTANSGLFDPGNANFSNGFSVSSANTSSPVVTHSSYSFQSSDVGAWFFLKSGTNSIPGWYKIASVSGGAATLSAANGAGVTYPYNQPTSVAGCGTSSSLTAQTGSVDYSQQSSSISLTGLTTSGASTTISSTSAAVVHIGNSLRITGGTNFTAGVYAITNVSAGTSFTVDRNATTGSGSSGTAGLGGALGSPGYAASLIVAGSTVFVQYATYSVSGSSNVAGGNVSIGSQSDWRGYQSVRGDLGTAPVLSATAGSINIVYINAANSRLQNLSANANGQTSVIGFNSATRHFGFKLTATGCATGFGYGPWIYVACNAVNCTTNGFTAYGSNLSILCSATIPSGANAGFFITGSGGVCVACVASGPGSNGFSDQISTLYVGCVAYGVTGSGYRYGFLSTSYGSTYVNCVSYGNTYGFGTYYAAQLINCAYGGNTYNLDTGGAVANNNLNPITLTANPFNNANSGDFSLNNTAGGGALLKLSGYGTIPIGTIGYPDVGAAQSQTAGANVNVVSWLGSTVNALSGGNLPANVTAWLGTAVTAATAGVPDVNAKNAGNQPISASGTITLPGAVASTTNITAASGVTLASSQTFTNSNSANQTGDSYAKVTNGSYGLSALQTLIANLNNLSALATLAGPSAMEVPASGSIAYPFTFLVKDAEGHLLDLSASPTVAAANAAGTSRSGNLSSVTHAGTGQYTFTYTVASTAAEEGLSISASGTASSDSTTRLAYASSAVVAVDTATSIASILTQTSAANQQANVTAGLTTQGYTTARAGKLDNLDTNVASRVATTALPANFGALGITSGGAISQVDFTSVAYQLSIPVCVTGGTILTAGTNTAQLNVDGAGNIAGSIALIAAGGINSSSIASGVLPGNLASLSLVANQTVSTYAGGAADADAAAILSAANSAASNSEAAASQTTSAAIAAALASSNLTILSPVIQGGIQIVEKDAYLVADGRQLIFDAPAGSNWPASLEGWTVTFTATKAANNTNAGTTTITATGVVDQATPPSQAIHLELSSSLTTGLAPGVGNAGYNFDIVATNGSSRATLVKGQMTVLANVTP